MMSFCRKYVKTFTRQWLGKISMMKDQHKLWKYLFLSSCSGSSIFQTFIGRKWNGFCHPDNIRKYYEMHPLMENLREIQQFTSTSSPLKPKPEARADLFFGWTLAGLLSCLTAQWDFTVLFSGVPAGAVSKASHVSESISVSTSPISVWPKPANCDFERTLCFCFSSSQNHEVIQVDCHVLSDNAVVAWVQHA